MSNSFELNLDTYFYGMEVKVHRTGFVIDGNYVEEYSIRNNHGFEITLSNFGCTIMNFIGKE